mgnify:CR=1 FL=1
MSDERREEDETEDAEKAAAEQEADAEKAEAQGPALVELTKPEEERPFFARAYPHTPELEPLIVAFDRGNYAKVRAEARTLADKTPDAAVKAAAEDLLRRTRPDPLSAALVLIGLGLLVYLAFTYLGHAPHEAPH